MFESVDASPQTRWCHGPLSLLPWWVRELWHKVQGNNYKLLQFTVQLCKWDELFGWCSAFVSSCLSSCLIGASLSEPHINHDNRPCMENCIYVSIYVSISMYLSMSVSFTLRLSHPGSWGPCTPWNTPCISVYWHAHMHDLQLHALDWTVRTIVASRTTGATRVCREDYWRRQVHVGECTDTWYKRIQPTKIVEL